MNDRTINHISRRAFMGTTFAALPALAAQQGPRHLVSLSFDDGFRKSFTRTAKIHEDFGLKACLNVLAGPHRKGFNTKDPWLASLGDFELWNELSARGHEVMPHSYMHANLGKLPLEEAQKLILQCLDIFDQELKGFDRKQSVFSFPYNSSNRALEAWLMTQVRAFRSGGSWVNELPSPQVNRLSCTSWGPRNCEHHLDTQLDKLLKRESGWLIYNLHGLDDEGWGPIRADYLARLLERLSAMDSVEVLPVGHALTKYAPRN